jgi:SAM-dependent methyltransferase
VPILAVLQRYFADRRRVLEIGSGTGQHAAFFAERWPWLRWQPSDHPDHLPGIEAWRAEAALLNLLPPVALQVELPPATGLRLQEGSTFDAAFTANTLHIMSWEHVQALFAALPPLLRHGALLAVYGPFNYGGRYSSDSNAQFDGWLKARDPRSGIRDAEAVQALAADNGFTRLGDLAMPANNRVLLWRLG